jgi:hypothetical protein
MAARVLNDAPGLPGLFLATLFSATLSVCFNKFDFSFRYIDINLICINLFLQKPIFFTLLGTISSGINSLTTVLWEDFLKDRYHQRLGDSGAEVVIKALTVLFGVIAIAMAFAWFSFVFDFFAFSDFIYF